MDQPFYAFTILDEAHRFDFVSEGKEQISKTIIFYESDNPKFVTLTLANVLPDGQLDIATKSNNGDIEKVLSTVFQAIVVFLTHNPNVIVCFTGSSVARTRLYQIAISREMGSVTQRFNIWGLTDKGLEEFVPHRKCSGFFISFKNVNIV